MTWRTAVGSIAFTRLLIAPLCGGASVNDVDAFDGGLEPIAGARDDVVSIPIAAAGFTSIAGVLAPWPHVGRA